MRITNRPNLASSRSFRPVVTRRVFSRAGFTLLESLIASVILAMGSLSLAVMLLGVQSQSEAMGNTFDATAAAKQLMEEIVARPILISSGTDNPGWGAGNTNKATYDSAFDYHGYTDTTPSPVTYVDTRVQASQTVAQQTTAAAAVATADASSVAAKVAGQCQRTVSVRFVEPPSALITGNNDFVVVVVVATPSDGRGAPVRLTRFMTGAPVSR